MWLKKCCLGKRAAQVLSICCSSRCLRAFALTSASAFSLLCPLEGKSSFYPLITLFYISSSRLLSWSEVPICCFTHLLSFPQPPLKMGAGCVLFTAVSLAFQAMPSSWYRPLTNIYWMNKWMKLKRIEVKYQRLKIKWPCLCVFLNPEVLTCILFHSGILFNMNYGNRFLRASCFLVPLKTWC